MRTTYSPGSDRAPVLQQNHEENRFPQERIASDPHFADILIFEARLRQISQELYGERRKYLLIFLAILFVLIYSSVQVFFQGYWASDEDPPWVHLTLLVFTTFLVVYFFGTGLYREKISRPKSYAARCQRVLRDFQMTFSQDGDDGQLHLIRRKIPSGFVEKFNGFKERHRRSELSSGGPSKGM